MANKRLFVPRFWLQETPVTNALYAACFVAGYCTTPERNLNNPGSATWDDPAIAQRPVYGLYAQAQQYCEWAGGRLPSIAELMRAAQGESETPGIKALTEASIACRLRLPVDPAMCKLLDEMRPGDFPPGRPVIIHPVGSTALDKGPFGHLDLYGSVAHFTRTSLPDLPNAAFCGLMDGATDFVTMGPPESTTKLALKYQWPIEEAAGFHSWMQPFTSVETTSRSNEIVFRCAFDRLPQ